LLQEGTPLSRTLFIPTLNEIEGLKALYDRIPFDIVDEVVIVDAGSSDGTREFWTDKNRPFIHQEKRGRGEAFRIAERNSTGEYFLIYSPDGNEDPDDIEKLFKKAEEGFDLVIASRFAKGSRNEEDGKLLPLRAWVNRIFTWLANTLFNKGPYVTDTINGFRVFKRDSFNAVATTEIGFPIEYQTSIRFMKKRFRIAEIPTIEGDRIGGESKAKSLPVGWGHLKVLAQEILGGAGIPGGGK
jgi:glycosyltransferase involved in cell wall biosynthesis